MKLEKAAQGVAQCEVSAYAPSCRRCVANTAVTKLQISPLIVNGFKNGFHQWIQHIFLVLAEHKEIFFPKIFFCFQNLDALYRPVAGKPLVLEDFVLGMGTSVACALSAETIFEIMRCIADADMLPRGRMGFSILATPTIEIFRFLDVGHSFERIQDIMPPGQNAGRTKCPPDKMSPGQNAPRKIAGQNAPRTKCPPIT